MRRNKYIVAHCEQTEQLRIMDSSGLTEPEINSLSKNRSHKLKASTDVGQNASLALLDVVVVKLKAKRVVES